MNLNETYGSFTAQRVSELQSYYGLRENGIADPRTLELIEQILSGPYVEGGSHSDVITLKEKLTRLGFGGMNLNETYGSFTAQRVSEFQSVYGLNVHGIADPPTLAKIDEIFNSPYQLGKSHADMIKFKQMLTSIGYGGMNLNETYGSFTDQRVREFQTAMGLPVHGILDELTIDALNRMYDRRPVYTYSYFDITLTRALDIQMAMSVPPQTDLYRNNNGFIRTADLTFFDSNSRARVTTATNVYESASTSSHIYFRATAGKEYVVVNRGSTWTQLAVTDTWRNAKRSDVINYITPETQDNFQHLVLSSSPQVSSNQINRLLDGKGILDGKGQAFIDGGRTNQVNEVYLIAHALLETGHGRSDLANGIEVGKSSNGTLTLVTSSNRSSLTDIKTTYNMFGIGAIDGNARTAGAIRAYQEGWFTPESAIRGGAQFIGERYIHNSYNQDTLYKMRWNPANPGFPQYATDMGWAAKQVSTIKSMYNQLDNPIMIFDIPRYK
jgi:mannosyl-glycoprotein endo-beta-N-acetylglucosaminidase